MLGLKPTGAHSGVFALSHLATLWKLTQMLVPGRAVLPTSWSRREMGSCPPWSVGTGLLLPWLLTALILFLSDQRGACPSPAAGRAARLPPGEADTSRRGAALGASLGRKHLLLLPLSPESLLIVLSTQGCSLASGKLGTLSAGAVLRSCQLNGPGERLIGKGGEVVSPAS